MRLVWFEVQGYKNLRHPVRLDDMQAYNVLHGDNGIGKSNLLEAIAAFFEVLPDLYRPQLQALHSEPLRNLFSGPSSEHLSDLLARRWATEDGSEVRVDTLVGQPVREAFGLQSKSPIRLSAEFDFLATDLTATQKVIESRGTAPPAEFRRMEPGRHRVAVQLTLKDDGKTARLSLAEWSKAGQALSPTGIMQALMVLLSQPQLALLPHSRRVLPAIGLDKTEGEAYSYRDLIPPELCLKLNDSEGAEGHGRVGWASFQAALEPFAPLLGGPIGVEWDRSKRRYRLFVRQGGGKLHSWLLAAGLQQVMSLLGWLSIHPASLVLLEEPELNLRYTLQLRLREALLVLCRGAKGKQILLSTHSVAFESDQPTSSAFFYAMERNDDVISVRKRSVAEAAVFTGNEPYSTPGTPAQRLPPCWVSSEGLVEVPERIRGKLGVENGGGVFFVERKDTGHVELLNEGQFYDLIEPRPEPAEGG
jgi:hypothetical protein